MLTVEKKPRSEAEAWAAAEAEVKILEAYVEYVYNEKEAAKLLSELTGKHYTPREFVLYANSLGYSRCWCPPDVSYDFSSMNEQQKYELTQVFQDYFDWKITATAAARKAFRIVDPEGYGLSVKAMEERGVNDYTPDPETMAAFLSNAIALGYDRNNSALAKKKVNYAAVIDEAMAKAHHQKWED